MNDFLDGGDPFNVVLADDDESFFCGDSFGLPAFLGVEVEVIGNFEDGELFVGIEDRVVAEDAEVLAFGGFIRSGDFVDEEVVGPEDGLEVGGSYTNEVIIDTLGNGGKEEGISWWRCLTGWSNRIEIACDCRMGRGEKLHVFSTCGGVCEERQ